VVSQWFDQWSISGLTSGLLVVKHCIPLRRPTQCNQSMKFAPALTACFDHLLSLTACFDRLL
jgi:hypothetical protein